MLLRLVVQTLLRFQGGSLGGFSAGTINFLLAHLQLMRLCCILLVQDLTINTLGSSSGAVTFPLGSGNGLETLLSQVLKLASTFTMDGSNFGGTMDVGKLTASGKYYDFFGYRRVTISASTIGTVGNLLH